MRLIICIALLLALCIVGSEAVCPVRSCSLTDPLSTPTWLNTSSMAAAVRGASVTFYPVKRNGDLYDAVAATLSIVGLGEITPALEWSDHCNVSGAHEMTDAYYATHMPRHLLLEEACCETVTREDVFHGNVGRGSAIVNITYPAWPDFYMLFSATTVNETVTIDRPPTDLIGPGYTIRYEAEQVKLDVEIHNWPWITDEQPEQNYNDTFLQFFFMTDTVLDQVGRIHIYDGEGDKVLHYSATSPNAAITIDFLKVYTADGVDHFSLTNRLPPLPIFNATGITIPAIISLCQDLGPIIPRFKNMTYDPNLNAVFLGDQGDTGNPLTPEAKAKSKLHPAAYAVPIAIAVVIIIAGAVYALFIHPRRTAKLKVLPATSQLA